MTTIIVLLVLTVLVTALIRERGDRRPWPAADGDRDATRAACDLAAVRAHTAAP